MTRTKWITLALWLWLLLPQSSYSAGTGALVVDTNGLVKAPLGFWTANSNSLWSLIVTMPDMVVTDTHVNSNWFGGGLGGSALLLGADAIISQEGAGDPLVVSGASGIGPPFGDVGNLTGTLPVLNAVNLTNLAATNLTGTLKSNVFPSVLPPYTVDGDLTAGSLVADHIYGVIEGTNATGASPLFHDQPLAVTNGNSDANVFFDESVAGYTFGGDLHVNGALYGSGDHLTGIPQFTTPLGVTNATDDSEVYFDDTKAGYTFKGDVYVGGQIHGDGTHMTSLPAAQLTGAGTFTGNGEGITNLAYPALPISLSNCVLALEGDSLNANTSGWHITVSNAYPSAFVLITNSSVGGTYAIDMWYRYTTNAYPYRPRDGTNGIYAFWGCANDAVGYTFDHSILTFSNCLQRAKNDGWRVMLFTLNARGWNGIGSIEEQRRQQYNDWMRKSPLWDYLVDVDHLFDTTNSPNYVDGIHLSASGQALLGQYVINVLRAGPRTSWALPQQQTPMLASNRFWGVYGPNAESLLSVSASNLVYIGGVTNLLATNYIVSNLNAVDCIAGTPNGTYTLAGTYAGYRYWKRGTDPWVIWNSAGTAWVMSTNLGYTTSEYYKLSTEAFPPTGDWSAFGPGFGGVPSVTNAISQTATTLRVNGTASFSGTVTTEGNVKVNGTVYANALSISNNATIGGTLTAANLTTPTNAPTDAYVLTAAGTSGATAWKEASASGGETYSYTNISELIFGSTATGFTTNNGRVYAFGYSDGVALTNVWMTNGLSTVYSPNANFTAGDSNKQMRVVQCNSQGTANNGTGYDLWGTITNVVDSTHVMLNVVCNSNGVQKIYGTNTLAYYGNDDATNLQAAVDFCWTNRIPKLKLSKMTCIGGYFQNSAGVNSIITTPQFDPYSEGVGRTLTVAGDVMPGQGSGAASVNGSTSYGDAIRGTSDGTWIVVLNTGNNVGDAPASRNYGVYGSLWHGGTNWTSGLFNNSSMEFRDLGVRLASNPLMGGFNFYGAGNVRFNRVRLDTTFESYAGPMPNYGVAKAYGIVFPKDGNNGCSANELRDSQVSQFYNGVYVFEHAHLENTFIQTCIFALYPTCIHEITANHLMFQGNGVAIISTGGSANIDFRGVDFENSRYPSWVHSITTAMDISDPNRNLRGYLSYNKENATAGQYPSEYPAFLTVKGGSTNLLKFNIAQGKLPATSLGNFSETAGMMLTTSLDTEFAAGTGGTWYHGLTNAQTVATWTPNPAVSGTFTATNGLVLPSLTNRPPAFAGGVGGAHLWSDGTNLCVTIKNHDTGTLTTNKVTLSTWP